MICGGGILGSNFGKEDGGGIVGSKFDGSITGELGDESAVGLDESVDGTGEIRGADVFMFIERTWSLSRESMLVTCWRHSWRS